MALIVSITEANAHMTTRVNASAWTPLDDTTKTAFLSTAEMQLDAVYVLDATIEKHKKAICEQALFLLQTGFGSDQRAALHAMGVAETDVTQETFSKLDLLPICLYASTVLASVKRDQQKAFVKTHPLTRDDSDYDSI